MILFSLKKSATSAASVPMLVSEIHTQPNETRQRFAVCVRARPGDFPGDATVDVGWSFYYVVCIAAVTAVACVCPLV